MNILIKSAYIIDPKSIYHNKKMDILIKNGKIDKIAKSIKTCTEKSNKNELEYSAKNLHISPGWFDLHVNFGEPGNEEKETLFSGCNAASSGGYTGVLTMPNTKPHIDNKAMIEFIKNNTKDNIVDVFPGGNITKLSQGDNIVEMHDMHKAGCIAFTDDKNSVMRNDVMKTAMLYSKDCNALIMNYPNDISISCNGSMNEGNISTILGLKGIPSIAEEMMVDRDISLCEYTNSRFHLSYLSTQNSIKKIKLAKEKGLSITTDVSLYNLFLTEDYIENFDTRYKTMPPLRTKKDTKSLIDALNKGIIDVISSDHNPQTEENKKIEFDNAKDGIIGLETAFGILGKYILPKTTLNKLIEVIAINPREVLQLPQSNIKEGEKANITLFDPTMEWVFTEKNIKSKSKNTPFIGETLIGKALAIYNNGRFKEC